MSAPGSPRSGVAGTTPAVPPQGTQPLPTFPVVDLPTMVRRPLTFETPTSSRRRHPLNHPTPLPTADVFQLLQTLTAEVAQLRAEVHQGHSSTAPSPPSASQNAGGTRRPSLSRSSMRPPPLRPSAGGRRYRHTSPRTSAHTPHPGSSAASSYRFSTDSSYRPPGREDDLLRHLEQQIDDKIQQAQLGTKRGPNDPSLMRMSHSPFVPSITSYAAPAGFVAPRFRTYGGGQDPYLHIGMFRSAMYPYGSSDAQLCSLFPGTLGEYGLRWFDKLPAASIYSFAQLAEQFVARFKTNTKTSKEVGALLGMRRGRSETLRDYNRRYWDLFNEIEDCTEDFAISSYKYGFSPGQSFRKSLIRTPPTTLQELQDRIDEEIRIEEDK